MVVSDGTQLHLILSGIRIEQSRDYYLGASFDLDGGEVTFYVKDLSQHGPLVSRTVSHLAKSLVGSSEFQIGDGWGFGRTFSEGLIDEVRLSTGVLPESELLINVPEPTMAGGLLMILGIGVLKRVAYSTPER